MVGGQGHAQAALIQGKWSTNHFTEGCVDPRASLDGYGKARPNRDSNPRTSKAVASHYTDYAIPAALSGFIASVSHRIKDLETEMTVFHVEKVGNYIHQKFSRCMFSIWAVLQ